MNHKSRIVVLLSACSLLPSTQVSALSTADQLCRSALGKGVTQLAQTVISAQGQCHAHRMAGDSDYVAVDCNDLAQLPLKSQAKITKASDKLGGAGGTADSACAQGGATVSPAALGYTDCPAPCDGQSVADYRGVGTCLACLAKREAAIAVQAAFGSMPPIVGKSDALKCQAAIGSAQQKYKIGRMKEQRRCQLLQDGNVPPATPTTDCATADLFGKVAKLRGKSEALIAKKCASSLSTLTSCGADIAAEQACIDSSADACAVRLFEALYPALPRTDTVHVPPGYVPGTPMPLVMLLHGYGASGALEEFYVKLTTLADTRGFLYTYPNGTVDAAGKRFWNATDACCNFDGSSVDDSAYLTDLIADISAAYSVDPKRVYIVGHSNGGFMAYRMACDHAETIAAVVSLAGAMDANVASCTPSEAVSMLQIHGTADATIAYGGGSIGPNAYPSAATTVDDWITLNGCSSTPDAAVPPLDLVSSIVGAETTVTRYATGCAPGGHAELWTMNGGGHIPSLTANFAPRVIDFLFAHPKP